ncbi:MAG: DUF952 domain-containing protein [Alphaproteobacteria bacterium]|nr:DUF952 domain-containing protein [Alphaproteobacteria bacterium]
MAQRIYKIVSSEAWSAALVNGAFAGAPIDEADGFIHLSTAGQVRETAARHFARQASLLLIAFDPEAFGSALRWEISRGGALFPHLYAPLDVALALSTDALPLDREGKHIFPPGIP